MVIFAFSDSVGNSSSQETIRLLWQENRNDLTFVNRSKTQEREEKLLVIKRGSTIVVSLEAREGGEYQVQRKAKSLSAVQSGRGNFPGLRGIFPWRSEVFP